MDINYFICGAGHQGLSMAAHLALNGERVTLWNRTLDNIKEISTDNTILCDGIVNGKAIIEKASDKMDEVVSKVVLVTTPSSAHKDVAKQLAPFVTEDMVIVLNPGRTFGAIEFGKTLMDNGAKILPHIAETQTIIYTCRKSGKRSTTIFALKESVGIASLRNDDIQYILEQLPECMRCYFTPKKSFLETSLSNVGMILHCAPVLMNIGWIESDKVDFKYYYDGISKSVSRFLEKMDEERIMVSKACGINVESVAEWLQRTYDVKGNNLYECIRNNEAYKEIDSPPTIQCRYILEDVPNGLVPIEYLGKGIGIDTKCISTVIDLANEIFDLDFREQGRCFSLEELRKYLNIEV